MHPNDLGRRRTVPSCYPAPPARPTALLCKPAGALVAPRFVSLLLRVGRSRAIPLIAGDPMRGNGHLDLEWSRCRELQLNDGQPLDAVAELLGHERRHHPQALRLLV